MRDAPFDDLVKSFAGLPGLGPRSARRIALHLLTGGRTEMEALARRLQETAAQLTRCSICGNLDQTDPCRICSDQSRNQESLCVISDIADLWAIERTGAYRGQYHILGGLLSALDGVTRDDLAFKALETRLEGGSFKEVILALPATVDGQSTAHVVEDLASRHHNRLSITRLARGLPVGGALDYLDDGTIMTAFKARG